jgi:hypothetical protein
MNEQGFLYLFIFITVFILGPIFGLIAVIQDVSASRKKGRELRQLDELASGIKDHLRLLRSGDIAGFKATLSNWLEQFAHQVDSEWIRNCIGLFLQGQAIILGEISRRVLEGNKEYRQATLVRSYRLVEAIQSHMPENMMQRTGDLIALALCRETIRRTERVKAGFSPKTLVITALSESSYLLTTDVVAVQTRIDDTLAEIAQQCEPDIAGIPIVILKWAQGSIIDLGGRSFRRSIPFSVAVQDVARQFRLVAEAYAAGKLPRVAKIVYGIA